MAMTTQVLLGVLILLVLSPALWKLAIYTEGLSHRRLSIPPAAALRDVELRDASSFRSEQEALRTEANAETERMLAELRELRAHRLAMMEEATREQIEQARDRLTAIWKPECPEAVSMLSTQLCTGG